VVWDFLEKVTMPESNKAAKRRIQKANREAGIGDADGRMTREKAAPKMMKCTVCGVELKATKSNADLNSHSESKHSKPTEECFPGSTAISLELQKGGKQAKEDKKDGAGGGKSSKKAAKAKAEADMLAAAGLLPAGAKKKKKKVGALKTAQGAAKTKVAAPAAMPDIAKLAVSAPAAE
jgi:hypothetical protein